MDENSRTEIDQNGELTNETPSSDILLQQPSSAPAPTVTRAFFSENEPVIHEASNNFAVPPNEEYEDDEEEVSVISYLFIGSLLDHVTFIFRVANQISVKKGAEFFIR